jgi:hypothetical protein
MMSDLPVQEPVFAVLGSPAETLLNMPIRDVFAALAMTAMLTDHGDSCEGYRVAVATKAYQVADVMLDARKA